MLPCLDVSAPDRSAFTPVANSGGPHRLSRSMCHVLAVMCAAAFVLTPVRSADGQSAPTPPDSARADSTRVDSIALDPALLSPTEYRHHHGLLGALYSLVIAPVGILFFAYEPSRGKPSRLGFWKDHGSLFVGGGRGANHDDQGFGQIWTGSASIELLRGGLFSELRLEHFRAPEYLQYRTVRLGRLIHPLPKMAGGVMVGYRDVGGSRPHEGIEVSFPFIAGEEKEWLRLETAYVMSTKQSSWNYRVQAQRFLGQGPLFAGVSFDLKSWTIRRHGTLSHGTLSVLIGTMYTWH